MSEIPQAVLSEHFQARMKGRRLRSAIFLTYQFEPGFFEQDVLPVFLDIPLSHAVPIRLIQMEDALRDIPGHLAVYYDANGLIPDAAGSAKLDVGRIPIRHRTGVFHPKNVFLLVEDIEPDEDGYHFKTLIIASMSANLTRSGWWENIEVCHIEEIPEGDKTRLKDDLRDFLLSIRRAAQADRGHQAIEEILGFIRDTESRKRKSTGGQLRTHFYAGGKTVTDFLDEVAGSQLQGMYLEIISPFFDDAKECRPLNEMIQRFNPKEVRVFLPRAENGDVLCRKEIFESVKEPSNVGWGNLGGDFMRLGKSEDAGRRYVHAKVYRFFSQNPKREICFLGSPNLTSAAHQAGGNVETGFLVDWIPPRRPEFWMTPEERDFKTFQAKKEDETSAKSRGTFLNLRYNWETKTAFAFWDALGESPVLRLEARSFDLGTLPVLPSRDWVPLDAALSKRISESLAETSIFQVHGEHVEPGLLLVQEEGMAQKPSTLLHLSAADILRYWALLTPDQRAEFLDKRAPEAASAGQGMDLVVRTKIGYLQDTLFDRFAGFFHAFGILEKAVRKALDEDHAREADYRLFGKKYDSLGNLLDRLVSEGDKGDAVDQYVILLCARQLCREVSKDYQEFWADHSRGDKELNARFADLETIRERLTAQDPVKMPEFLDWFDKWFLKRAVHQEKAAA